MNNWMPGGRWTDCRCICMWSMIVCRIIIEYCIIYQIFLCNGNAMAMRHVGISYWYLHGIVQITLLSGRLGDWETGRKYENWVHLYIWFDGWQRWLLMIYHCVLAKFGWGKILIGNQMFRRLWHRAYDRGDDKLVWKLLGSWRVEIEKDCEEEGGPALGWKTGWIWSLTLFFGTGLHERSLERAAYEFFHTVQAGADWKLGNRKWVTFWGAFCVVITLCPGPFLDTRHRFTEIWHDVALCPKGLEHSQNICVS